MSVCCTVSEIFSVKEWRDVETGGMDKARYWWKIVIFSYPLAFDAPVRQSPSEYCHPVWYMGKLESWGYPTVNNL